MVIIHKNRGEMSYLFSCRISLFDFYLCFK